MKILYLVYRFPAWPFITNQITGLVDLGHDVTILAKCSTEHGEIINDEKVVKYDLLNKTFYYSNFDPLYLSRYNCGRNKIIDFIRKMGINFIKNPLITLKILFLIPLNLRNFWELLDWYLLHHKLLNKKIDIINVAISHPESIREAFFFSKIMNAPFTLTFRASDFHQKDRMKILKDDRIVRKASKIITISEYNRSVLQKMFNTRQAIDVVHSCINPNFLNSRQKEYRKSSIICICRFVPQKGVNYLLEAYNILKQRKIRYHCTLVGFGPEERNYLNMVKKYDLRSIEFKGFMTQEQIKKELSKSKLFVLPCIVTIDGYRDILPNVLKEAMAMGVPVVTSNICGIGELVEDGVSGILVPPKDPEAIADAIEKLFKNPKLRKRMGKAGRKKIEKDFNIKIEIKKLEKIFYEAKNN